MFSSCLSCGHVIAVWFALVSGHFVAGWFAFAIGHVLVVWFALVIVLLQFGVDLKFARLPCYCWFRLFRAMINSHVIAVRFALIVGC